MSYVYSHALQGMAIEVPESAAVAILEALQHNPNVSSIGNHWVTEAMAQTVAAAVDRVEAESGVAPNTGLGVTVAVLDATRMEKIFSNHLLG